LGTYTFDNFRDYLKLEMGQRTDIETPTNYYSIWINSAYLGISTRDKFFDMRKSFYFPQFETSGTATTTAGTAYVLAPTDILVLRRIWNTTNDAYLSPMTKDEYYKKLSKATTASRGTPTRYVRLGNKIYLDPTPDAATALTIYYRMSPAILVNDDDVTALGPEWDDPILDLAAIRAHTKLKEFDFAELKKKTWVEDVTNLITIYRQEERANETYLGLDEKNKSEFYQR